jgi:VanZ family protein
MDREVTPLRGFRFRAWWPALLWAGLIFYGSTDAFSPEHTGTFLARILRWAELGIAEDHLHAINFLVRKSAHVAEYFVVCLLVYRGISGARPSWRWSWACAALLITAGYSVLDEFHQSFVPSRVASPWDSLLDCTGALVALMVIFLLLRFFPRRAAA